MERLTVPDEPIEGGVRRSIIDTRAVRGEAMKIYWALKKYEDTGLTPEEIVDGKMLTGWIPVDEKLPEYDGLYLVCLDDGYISSVEYMTGRSGKRDWDLWSDNGEVIAWMPLPEPYRREAGQAETEDTDGSN